MIRVNLLPFEKRRVERTPLPRFLLILSTAAAMTVAVLGVLWGLVRIRTVTDSIHDKKTALAELKEKVDEFNLLDRQKKELTAKLGELRSVIPKDEDRVLYWRALNGLWEAISNHPKVWIDSIRALDEQAASAEAKRDDRDLSEAPAYGVAMGCHVAGIDVPVLTGFRDGLRNQPELVRYLPNLNFNPQWTVHDETGFEEKHSMSFSTTILGPYPGAKPPPRRGGPGPAKKP